MGRFDPLWSRPYYRDSVVVVAAYAGVAAMLLATFAAYPFADVGVTVALGIAVFVLTAFAGAIVRKLVRRRAASRETEERRSQR